VNQATLVTEIDLGNLFVEQARAISAREQTKKVQEAQSKKQEQCSPLVEVGFSENVVGRVASTHLQHREDCVFNPHCAYCVQAGRRTMEFRQWSEIDEAAETKLLRLVKKGNSEAVMFYLKRKQRDETIWRRIRTLLGL
jgi:hypothetical protein